MHCHGNSTPLGYIECYNGTTYNGGNAPTLSGGTTAYGIFIPYQTQDGSWRMRFNCASTFETNAVHTFTVAGCVSPAYAQAISTANSNASKYVAFAAIPASANPLGIQISYNEAVGSTDYMSGDVALSSKPTWFDKN